MNRKIQGVSNHCIFKTFQLQLQKRILFFIESLYAYVQKTEIYLHFNFSLFN